MFHSRFKNLREHQYEGADVADNIVSGRHLNKIVTAYVTPGGGKTLLASIFSHTLLDSGIVEQVCLVCPRDSLRSQLVSGFTEPERDMTRIVLAEGNKSLETERLFRASGYVTTYQSISRAPKRHLWRFGSKRYLLVLDEPHHLSDSDHKSWLPAIKPLVEQSAYVLLMSGTLYRHDRKRIPFVSYDAERKPVADIRYTRRNALDEQAVLPITVKMTDGEARYWHSDSRFKVKLSDASSKEMPKALKTLLIDEKFRNDLIGAAVQEWQAYRREVYKSRMIVLADRQDRARSIGKYLREHHKAEVALAISDDPDANKVIRKFRDGSEGNVLVTVGMAYEGLDVPDATHLVCLTDIRSRPWLEQAFARVTRVNPVCGVPYSKQRAYLYVPDDPIIASFIREFLDEQDERYRDQEEKNGTGVAPSRYSFSPIGAEKGSDRYADQDVIFSRDDSSLIDRTKRRFPACSSWSALEILRLAKELPWPTEAA